MKAYQCDRCMSYYTENKEVTPNGADTTTKVTGVKIRTNKTDKGQGECKSYDLCDACAKRLMDFLESR